MPLQSAFKKINVSKQKQAGRVGRYGIKQVMLI